MCIVVKNRTSGHWSVRGVDWKPLVRWNVLGSNLCMRRVGEKRGVFNATMLEIQAGGVYQTFPNLGPRVFHTG